MQIGGRKRIGTQLNGQCGAVQSKDEAPQSGKVPGEKQKVKKVSSATGFSGGFEVGVTYIHVCGLIMIQ